MDTNRSHSITVVLAVATLLAVVMALLPGSATKAVGQETRTNTVVEDEWTVTAGEKTKQKVACPAGYGIGGMAWSISSDGAAPPRLKVITKVSNNQTTGRFVASYPEQSSYASIVIHSIVTCSPAATSQDTRMNTVVENEWTVTAGEKTRLKVGCDGYGVAGMDWSVNFDRAAPGRLDIITKVPQSQRKGIFVASYPGGSPDTSIVIHSIVTCAPAFGDAVVLNPHGLGVIDFGATPAATRAEITAALGAGPTFDTGLIASGFTDYGVCPGTKLRVIEYQDLRLYFGDAGYFAPEGTVAFFHWSYFGEPVGLATFDGIGIGSTVAEAVAFYEPLGLELSDSDPFGPLFTLDGIDDHEVLRGYLTGTDDTGVVTGLEGGTGCGI